MNFGCRNRHNETDMPAYVCDLSGARPTAATVDSLARLALILRREGSRLVLRGASPDLVQLIAFMGLTEVLGVEPGR
jgi:anti-anti-sigma regulatory factor